MLISDRLKSFRRFALNQRGASSVFSLPRDARTAGKLAHVGGVTGLISGPESGVGRRRPLAFSFTCQKCGGSVSSCRRALRLLPSPSPGAQRRAVSLAVPAPIPRRVRLVQWERVNGVVVNLPEFYEAFDVKAGDRMSGRRARESGSGRLCPARARRGLRSVSRCAIARRSPVGVGQGSHIIPGEYFGNGEVHTPSQSTAPIRERKEYGFPPF